MALLTSNLRSRTLATVVVTVMLCAHATLQTPETLENDVKAAFLFNFTKFVDWPDTAFGTTDEALRICVIADAAFTRSVDRIVAGETVRGRPLQRITPSSAELTRCHVLYMGAAHSEEAERLLAAVDRAPVLTVGETPTFMTYGAAISFVVMNNRVRFDINPRAAERAGLTVSSKLLRVARQVETKGRS
jgi:YfiR/HmsC-like